MRRLWERLRAWLSRWWRTVQPPEAPPALEPAATSLEAWQPVEPPPKPRKTPAERYQAMRLRKDILNKLDHYQIYVRRLKKYDPETYATYRRLGAYVAPAELEADYVEVPGSFMKVLPGFGALALAINAEDNVRPKEAKEEECGSEDDLKWWIHARFAFFTKVERLPCDVEKLNHGVYYRCRFYYDGVKQMAHMFKGRDRGLSIDLVLNVADDGTITALRMRQDTKQYIHHRRGFMRGETTTINHRKWAYPDVERKWGSAEHVCTMMFLSLVNHWVAASQSSMIRVTATKSNVVMPFVVDALKTPQFFADREKVQNENGNTRPIFHLVRPHQRRGKDIRLHFAGLRDFQWNGYAVRISVPGKDHVVHDEYPGGALEESTEAERRDPHMLSPEAAAEFIADAIGAPGKSPGVLP